MDVDSSETWEHLRHESSIVWRMLKAPVSLISDNSLLPTASCLTHTLHDTHTLLIAWGGSYFSPLRRVWTIQKIAIGTLNWPDPQDACRDAAKELRIFTINAFFILNNPLPFKIRSNQTEGSACLQLKKQSPSYALDRTHNLSALLSRSLPTLPSTTACQRI